MAPAARKARPLGTYARKRRFDKTPEPRPRAVRSGRTLRYCIQEHAASRLHHDFRLELDGVLKSWAVPKGPSLDPDDKRLAVQVEDHPVAYGDFEGVIAEGEYGGGTVLLWDRGSWEPEGDARDGLARGKLSFQLHGEKLRGRWALVRMHGRASDDDGRQWLLIKERDDEAKVGVEILATRTDSVKSGKDLVYVADAHGATPRQRASAERALATMRSGSSSRSVRGGRASRAQLEPGARRARREPRTPGDVRALRASRRQSAPRPSGTHPTDDDSPGRPGALPRFVAPQLATLVDTAPEGDEWLHEIKFDGYRMLCRLQRSPGVAGKSSAARRPSARKAGEADVRIWSRNGIEWTDRLPNLVSALSALPAEAALIDGELVHLDAHGRSEFSALKTALGAGRLERLSFEAFDLLHLDGRDLRPAPLLERKRALAALLKRAPARGPLRFCDHQSGSGGSFFQVACKAGLEGIVSKRAAAPYRSGRVGDWVKVKCVRRQEFVILGFTPPSRAESSLGSLMLGVHEDGRLRYAGRVGTGFDQRERASLRRRLLRLAVKWPPVEPPRDPGLRGATWARPELVGEVQFTEWTPDGRLRHPSFQGLREDKSAADVVVEKPRALARVASKAAATAKKPRAPRGASNSPAARIRAPRTGSAEIAGVTLTHPDKLLWPEEGITKADLAAYYEAIAARILPHIAGRPLTLVRCPDGHAGGCFFQKHATGRQPPSIEVLPIPERGRAAKKAPYMVIEDAAGLVALAQLGALELHIWGSRRDDVERPDRMVFDLDPDPSVGFTDVMLAARALKTRLEDLGLQAFAMTTGGKGLHVVVPLRRRLPFEGVHDFSAALAREMAAEAPERFVAQASKARRKGRIFIDYLRNSRGATAVCPFSTRARPHAPVAAPVAWNELREGLAASQWTLRTLPERLARQRRDPWAGYAAAARVIPAGALRRYSRR